MDFYEQYKYKLDEGYEGDKPEREEMRDKIIELLKSTERKGMENLIQHMEETGFFEAPSSGGFHGCKVGGLMEHSLNVFEFGDKNLMQLMGTVENYHSWIISSLLHDLGKAGYHDKPNYIPNFLTGGKLSDKKPFETNKDRLYIAHEIVSITIASKFIELTEEEEFAILYHNALYVPTGRDLNGKERPLQTLLHFSDLWCSRFIETKGE